MERRMKTTAVVAALLFGGCSPRSSGRSTPPDDGGAWMDGATVVVARSTSTGRETVTLADEASGFEQVMDDEPLAPDARETDDPTP